MAKFRPRASLQEMEKDLGYTVDSIPSPNSTAQRFYSDLRPVSSDAQRQIKKDYQVLKRKLASKSRSPSASFGEPGQPVSIGNETDKTTIVESNTCSLHRFSVDIELAPDFSLPLLFTEIEASETVVAAELYKTQPAPIACKFFSLPQELREQIYAHALPSREWRMEPSTCSFVSAVGDKSGFYFPWGKEAIVLRINRRIRQEALPLAYRRTTFVMDDMDDATKLLLAIGSIGRTNITSLRFPWQSVSDTECRSEEFPDADDYYLRLPALHAMRCVQLLRQCKRLESLCICFDDELLNTISENDFRGDLGIQGLCTLIQLKKFEVWDMIDESLEENRHIQWLRHEVLVNH